MKNENASGTAIAVGLLRAAHQVLDQESRILDDPISIGLVPESSAAEIMARADRLQLDFLRVLRAGFGVRSRIMDGMRRGNIERSPTLPLAVARLCSRELLSGERYMEGR